MGELMNHNEVNVRLCGCEDKKAIQKETKKICYVVYKDPIEFEVEVPVCLDCGCIQVEEGFFKEVRKKAHRLYAEKMGFLSPEALKEIRKSLDLTQAQFAKYLDVNTTEICMWEKGINPISQALDALVRHKTSPEYLEEHREEFLRLEGIKSKIYKYKFI